MAHQFLDEASYLLVTFEGLITEKELEEVQTDWDSFNKKFKKVIFSLEKVEYINSSALREIIRIYKKVMQNKGEFVIVINNRSLLDLFEFTGLCKLFEIRPSLKEAQQFLKVSS